jgi:L-threonylcarbamoyladenylate synthase
VVAFPTDTVYGVGALAFQSEAVARLYSVKERPADKAIPVLVAQMEDMDRVALSIPAIAWDLAERYWPGALTLVLRRALDVPSVVTAGGDSVAVRCPDHPVPLALINACCTPLAATSANVSGRASPVTAHQVVDQLAGRVPLVIDGGKCPGGVPSTVIDVNASPPRLLRAGSVPAGELRELLPDLI